MIEPPATPDRPDEASRPALDDDILADEADTPAERTAEEFQEDEEKSTPPPPPDEARG